MANGLSLADLPAEILQEVFFWCLPTPSNANQHAVFMRREILTSPRHAPLLLCHVCRHWRDVALSSPNLWTTLSVIVRLGVAVPAPDLVSLWLSRSGALPLEISLHQQNESSVNCVAAGRVLDIFEEHISRWGKVRLELYGPRSTRLGIGGEKVGPLLKEFRLHISDDFSWQAEEDLFGVFNHAPQLQSLHVSRIPRLDLSAHSSIQVPWGQLAHLSLDYVPAIGTALRILDMTPNLESCSMKIDTTRGSLMYNPPQLPKLHTLSINLGFESLAGFLDHLIVPKLAHLAVSVRGTLEQYRWAHEQFDAFLTRSGCRIRRLEIHDTGMTSSEFASCIQHPGLQALTELVVDDTKGWTLNPFVTEAALDLLTVPSFNLPNSSCARDRKILHSDSPRIACLLPSLKRLTIRGNCFLSPDGTIAKMVESRWRNHSKEIVRLELMDVELPTNHMEDLRRLKEFQGEGLEVVFSQQY
ncbi:hypothetical protein NP233_g6275 [Leucocoprinus birnbaumii]|uniref:F-box domain-containing protein n=1 Tax=Leucocoprinus birnbaumii TaxID=56174 RepID=A0AAD5VTL4_9AGAR|nr:hypothetical protein NP233_g6275 [Leucocoprinus birnbaumii]